MGSTDSRGERRADRDRRRGPEVQMPTTFYLLARAIVGEDDDHEAAELGRALARMIEEVAEDA